MIDATIEEYNSAIIHARDKRIIESNRCQDIYWTVCGKEVAHRTKIFSNGKVIQDHFSVSPEYKR